MRQLALALSEQSARQSYALEWLPQLSEGEYRAVRGIAFRALELLGLGLAHTTAVRTIVSLALSSFRHGKPMRKTSEEIAGVLQEDNGGAVRGASADAVDRNLRGLASLEWLYWNRPSWQHGARGGFLARRTIRPGAALVAAIAGFIDAVIDRRWKILNARARAQSGVGSSVPRSRGTNAVSVAVQDPLSLSKSGTDGPPAFAGPA